jgi:hypothetical protein
VGSTERPKAVQGLAAAAAAFMGTASPNLSTETTMLWRWTARYTLCMHSYVAAADRPLLMLCHYQEGGMTLHHHAPI